MCRLTLTISAVLIFVACEDSAIIQEAGLLNGETPPSEKTGISGNMLEGTSLAPCNESFNSPGAGHGELGITACSADDPRLFEAREFTMAPLWGGGEITRFSHLDGCEDRNTGDANFMIGVNGAGLNRETITCRKEDGTSMLWEGVTYKIFSLEEESWFLAHWSDASASNPDVGAYAVGGVI